MLHGSADIFYLPFSKQKRNHTAPLHTFIDYLFAFLRLRLGG